MKDKLITIFAITMFSVVLVFGAWAVLMVMLVVFPLAILRCMFGINKNEGK